MVAANDISVNLYNFCNFEYNFGNFKIIFENFA